MSYLRDVFNEMTAVPQCDFKVEDKGCTWRVAGSCCYMEARPLGAGEEQRNEHKMDVQMFYPENMFMDQSSALHWQSYNRDILTAGKSVFPLVSAGKENCLAVSEEEKQGRFTLDVPIRMLRMPESKHLEDLHKHTEVSVRIAVTKKGSSALVLQTETEMFYTAMMCEATPADKHLIYKNKRWVTLTDWNFSKQAYKQVKEIDMNEFNLPTMEDLKKRINSVKAAPKEDTAEAASALAAELLEEDAPATDEIAAVEEATAEEPVEAPEEVVEPEAVEAEEPQEETIDAEAIVEADSKEAEEALMSASQEEPQAEEPAEPKSRGKRVNKPKKHLPDLEATIEMVSSTVPDDMTTEQILQEIRQLRELQKAAACRMANLATGFIIACDSAQKTLEQMRCILLPK